MIIFDKVTKKFSANSYGLLEVSFEVEPGELLLATGPSGSGKTTLMKLMTKEYTPTEGKILFDELDLDQLSFSKVHQLRRRIGVIFQDYRLLSDLNVWENVALPLAITGHRQHEIEERVTDLLKLVGMTDKAPLFPSQLSGGEAQRISIARSMAIGPSVIFADEPTGNLDSKTASKIAKLLDKINQLGTTVIFATHDPVVLDFFNDRRVLELDEGKLVKDSGTTKKAEQDNDKTKKDSQEKKDKSDNKQDEQKAGKTQGLWGGFWQRISNFRKSGSAPTDSAPATSKSDKSETSSSKNTAPTKQKTETKKSGKKPNQDTKQK